MKEGRDLPLSTTNALSDWFFEQSVRVVPDALALAFLLWPKYRFAFLPKGTANQPQREPRSFGVVSSSAARTINDDPGAAIEDDK